jgi:hypothetical protein
VGILLAADLVVGMLGVCVSLGSSVNNSLLPFFRIGGLSEEPSTYFFFSFLQHFPFSPKLLEANLSVDKGVYLLGFMGILVEAKK